MPSCCRGADGTLPLSTCSAFFPSRLGFILDGCSHSSPPGGSSSRIVALPAHSTARRPLALGSHAGPAPPGCGQWPGSRRTGGTQPPISSAVGGPLWSSGRCPCTHLQRGSPAHDVKALVQELGRVIMHVTDSGVRIRD